MGPGKGFHEAFGDEIKYEYVSSPPQYIRIT
jgi:hypothetical protein